MIHIRKRNRSSRTTWLLTKCPGWSHGSNQCRSIHGRKWRSQACVEEAGPQAVAATALAKSQSYPPNCKKTQETNDKGHVAMTTRTTRMYRKLPALWNSAPNPSREDEGWRPALAPQLPAATVTSFSLQVAGIPRDRKVARLRRINLFIKKATLENQTWSVYISNSQTWYTSISDGFPLT